MEASKCPKCGEEPHFLEHIEKWYCYGCNTYVDDGVEHICSEEEKKEECAEAIKEELKSLDEETKPECRHCGAELESLKDGKSYCFVCEHYQDEEAVKPEAHSKEANDAQKLLDAVLSQHPTKASEAAPAVAESKPELVAAPKEASVEPLKAAADVRMCPACGQALKWIEKYQRHYCYGCRKYAPKVDVDKPVPKATHSQGPKACPGCGGELKFIEKYSEFYCFSCKKYPLRELKKAEPKKTSEPAVEVSKKTSALLCPKCKGELKWIEKYSRHYCYKCKDYAPKGYGGVPCAHDEKKQCPMCKGAMKFVVEYNEWYCYKCKKYSLRPSKPVLLI